MTTNSSAGTDGKPTGQEQAVAQPAGESQGEENSSGEESIPRSRFVAAVNNAVRTTEQRMQQQIDDLKAQVARTQETPAQQPPTRAELQELVEAGSITRAQADALLDKQQKAEVKLQAQAEAVQTVVAIEHNRRVQADLTAYRELVGAVWEEGTPERDKVAKEYSYLTGVLRMPATIETELAAIRNAFGDLDTLKASKTARAGPADTHTETGGGRPEAGAGSGGGKDSIKSLSKEQREYYERGIKAGRYKSWDAVKEELKFARPRG